ncbi:MAG: aminomethyltransferase, partial [Qingshengfaniella sp.]
MTTLPVFPAPFSRAGVVTPGLPILPPGVERHPVPGGGSRAVQIERGDEITVQDREGLQPVEVVFFDPTGRSDAGMLGLEGGRAPEGLTAALVQGASGRRVARALEAAGFKLENADAALLFADGSHAGDVRSFTAASDGLLIVCAPGGAMEPHDQWAPSEVVLYVHRANPAHIRDRLAPPDPLADPLLDINIQPGQARP